MSGLWTFLGLFWLLLLVFLSFIVVFVGVGGVVWQARSFDYMTRRSFFRSFNRVSVTELKSTSRCELNTKRSPTHEDTFDS